MIFNPMMDISQEEMDTVIKGISDDGTISKETEEVLLNRINEAKAQGPHYLIGEVKRQFRWLTDAENGKKIAEAIEKLW